MKCGYKCCLLILCVFFLSSGQFRTMATLKDSKCALIFLSDIQIIVGLKVNEGDLLQQVK